MHPRARATIDPRLQFVLVFNLILVLAGLVLALPFILMLALVSSMGGARNDNLIGLLFCACPLLDAALTWLTVRCLRAYTTRLVVAIAVLSMPVYVVPAILFIASLTPGR